jgi:hypothetical protein
MSRREYKTINRRLQQGRTQSVKEGKYAGNKPPYGYQRRKLDREKGYTLEPDPDQAPIVKLIFEWYTNDLGVSRIVRRLNDMKIPTVKGGDWVNATIQGILRNPVYIGKVRWNWRPQVKKIINGEVTKERPRASEEDWLVTNGLHEAIVDEGTFQKAQELLAKNFSPKITAKRNMKNPLAGLIVCGKCGRRMARRPYYSGQQDSLICPVTSCDNVSSYLYLVEEKLLQALKVWLVNYKIQYEHSRKGITSIDPEMIKSAIRQLDKEMETYNKQLDSLHNLLEQGIYTTEKFLERNKVLNDKMKTTLSDRSTLEEQLNQLAQQEEGEKFIIPKVEKVIEMYYKLEDPEKKNILLKGVLDKVIYLKTTKGTKWDLSTMDDFELVLYPNMPKYIL